MIIRKGSFTAWIDRLSSCPENIARSLIKIGSVLSEPVIKVALSSSDMERGIEALFMRKGIVPPPIPWSRLFRNTVYKMGRGNGWRLELTEEILTSTFQDILMGANLSSDVVWRSGDLADVVERWMDEGKSEDEMIKLLIYKIKSEAWKIYVRNLDGRKPGLVRNFDPNANDPDDETRRQFLQILDLSSSSQSDVSNWMNLSRSSPEVRDLLRLLDEVISKTRDPKMSMLWNTIKESPDFKSVRELGEDDVTYINEEGFRITEPLYLALGKSKPNDIFYEFDKLKKLLNRIKPLAMEMLSK